MSSSWLKIGHSLETSSGSSEFFTNRVINMWNKLPNYIVTSETLNMFKNRVDNHFDEVLYHTRLNIA